jgi:hypothetical protein
MKTKLRLVLLLLCASVITYAQQGAMKATYTTKAVYMKEIPSIAEQIAKGTFEEEIPYTKEVNPKRRDANVVAPGKGLPHGIDPLWNQGQKTPMINGKEPIVGWDCASSNVTPTDPTGAVGPNHFVNAWNTSYRIWDKEGNALINSASLSTLFPGETKGDPIVVYDNFADRFVIMEFSDSPNGFLVAVCQGSDPVNDGWYTYRFNTGTFPDYVKLSIWSDGYYVTANKNSSSAGTSEVVYALERDKMIAGDEDAQMAGFPLPGITTSGFFSPLGFNANGAELPPVGNAPIVYMQDDAWSGVSEDHIKIWNINVNWDDAGSSTISDAQEIPTTPFDGVFDGGSFSNLEQPTGQDIDCLQATVMFMAQYRRFSSYNACVFNWVVDLDGNDDLAGIRWYEMRQNGDGQPWEIFQEGTFAQPDGLSAFAGNICMDVSGNIALAYTVVSPDVYPSLRYTGRLFGDASGEMTFAEESLVEGTQSNPSNRYGDYSQMTIDTDGVTFWSIGEYFTSGSRKNHVGAFRLAPAYENDMAVLSIDSPESGELSNAEEITVTLRNFGSNTLSDIPVSYSINGGTAVEETFAGPLESYESAVYTFAQTANLSTMGDTYEISVYAELAGDEQLENNEAVKEVTFLYPTDVGVSEILSPVSGDGLTETEVISVMLTNYGTEDHSGSFNVVHSVDYGSTIYEQFTGDLAAGESTEFSFDNTGDFSAVGPHNLMAKTLKSGDMNSDNNEQNVEVINEMCMPESNCNSGAGIRGVQVGDIDNISNCEEDGYGDYTDQNTVLYRGYTHDFVIVGHQGDQFARVWIDFNDNFVFEAEELVIDNEVLSSGQGSGVWIDSLEMELVETAELGEHLMRVRVSWGSYVPDNACQEMSWGETEDYTVTIDTDESVTELQSEEADLEVHYLDNNHFRAVMNTTGMDETLIVTVHDITGRKLIRNRVNSVNGHYEFNFDMSYAKPGMYLVRLGNSKFGKVQKIVVR